MRIRVDIKFITIVISKFYQLIHKLERQSELDNSEYYPNDTLSLKFLSEEHEPHVSIFQTYFSYIIEALIKFLN